METDKNGLKNASDEPSRVMVDASRAEVWQALSEADKEFFKSLNEQFDITFVGGKVRGQIQAMPNG